MSTYNATNSWLENLDKEEPLHAVEHAPETSTAPVEDADMPSWLRDLEKEPEQPVVSSAPVNAAPADEIPSWLQDQAHDETPPEPTHPDDWIPETLAAAKPVSEAPKPVKTTAPAAKPAARVEPPAPKPTQPAATRQPKPKPAAGPKETRKPETPPSPLPERTKSGRGILPPMTDAGLDQARELLAHAQIPNALQAYSALIRKGKMLEEITFDLKEALYRFPVEVSIWQTLGDAYMRANRLQDALDAYTKAEELLR
jgi:hypothetical protein